MAMSALLRLRLLLLLLVCSCCCLSSLPSVAGQSDYVQFSFCLISGTSNVTGGAQSDATFETVSWGVVTTNAMSYSPTGSYTATSASGYSYTNQFSTPVPIQLLTGVGNDNVFVLNSSDSISAASVDLQGFGLTSSYGAVLLRMSSALFKACGGTTCPWTYSYSPPYGQLLVQLYNPANTTYNASLSSPPFPCRPIPVNATVQFSFCLITAPSPTYNASVDTWSTVSYGIFTTTATQYTVPSTYFIASIINGYQFTRFNATRVPLVTAPYWSPALVGPPDNALTITGSTFAPLARTPTYHGLGLQSAYAAFVIATVPYLSTPLSAYDIVSSPCQVCGTRALLTVQPFNASAGSAPLACEPPSADQTTALFSFCLITGSYPTSTSPSTYNAVSYGIFTTVSSPVTPGVYLATSLLSGSQNSNSNSTPSPLSLLPVGPVQGVNFVPDNQFTLSTQLGPGLFTATTFNGLGLRSAFATIVLRGQYVLCADQSSDCGQYGQLTVQLYNDSTGATTLPCSPFPTPSSPSSSSTASPPSSSMSSPSVAAAGSSLLNGSLCVLLYGLPGNVDHPWSSATSLLFQYNSTPVAGVYGQSAVSIVSGAGTRTYTNRFGHSFTTPLSLVLSPSSAAGLLYLGSSLPVDSEGLLYNLSSEVQLPGRSGIASPSSRITLYNLSGVVVEAGASRFDAAARAFLSSVPGFVNVSIGADNVNALAVQYDGCQAPLTFTNGLRPVTQPTTGNGAQRIAYNYTLSDGLTYTVSSSLTVTASSAFATSQDQLGNPYQSVTNVTGTRTYTHLSTGSVLISRILGVTRAARFYPYSLLASSPGEYSVNTAPFLDDVGIEFSLSPPIPALGQPPGSAPQYFNSTSIRLSSTSPTSQPGLTEAYYTELPVPALQQQSYALLQN